MKQKFEIHFWNIFSCGLKIVAYSLMSSISIHNCCILSKSEAYIFATKEHCFKNLARIPKVWGMLHKMWSFFIVLPYVQTEKLDRYIYL